LVARIDEERLHDAGNVERERAGLPGAVRWWISVSRGVVGP
jgi:hypothetical protein